MSAQGLQVGIFLAGGLLLMLLGVVIFQENPTRRLNRVTAAMLFFGGLGSLMGALGASLETVAAGPETADPLEGPVPLGGLRQLAVLWEFFFPTLVYFALVFPRESEFLKRHPRIVWLLYLPYIFHLLLVVLFLTPTGIPDLDLQAGGGVLGAFVKVLGVGLSLLGYLVNLVYQAHLQLWAIVNIGYIIFAFIYLQRTRRGLENERLVAQTTLVMAGLGTSLGIYLLIRVVPVIFPFLTPPAWLQAFAMAMALVIGCGSIAWVIIRHQFLDVQVIAKRSLIYSAATGVVVGIYFLLYNWFLDFYRALAGSQEANTTAVQILFVSVAVIGFQPLLSRLENLVDRFFIRDRTDYRNILQQSVRNILGILDLDSLVRAVYQTLERAFLVDAAAVMLLDQETGAYRYVSRGPPPLRQGEWELKPPVAFRDEERYEAAVGEGVVDTFRRSRSRPGTVVFRRGDAITEALLQANGPVRFDQLLADLPKGSADPGTPLRGLQAELIVPLKHRNDLVGILSLGRKLADTGFNSEEITLLSVLGSQVAVAVENSRLHQDRLEQERIREELAVAREIQQTLLPHRFPRGKTFEVSAINLPSREIGGDYYDFIVTPLEDDQPAERVFIVIGDVSGKGPPAALLMASLQATLRAVYEVQPSLAAMAGKVNSVMHRTTDIEKFITLFIAEFEVASRELRYVNAGHNFPVLTRASGEQVLLEEGGLLVGVIEGATYEEGRLRLEPGDVLTLYTDGVTEALDHEDVEFGEERLQQVLRERSYLGAREIRDEIYREVLAFAGDRPQADDLTMVVLKIL
jgi:sigma-B regulation protein RsbU (phosphoserine phosphatase)